jgi:subtilisin family serine protease
MNRIRERRAAAHATLIAALVALLALACAGVAMGASPTRYARIEPVCGSPAPGQARCFALGRIMVPASDAGTPGVRALARIAATQGEGPTEGFTPAQLARAYGFDPEGGGTGQTVAVVDAYNDPSIEADLKAFDKQYGLPGCTAVGGCFRRVGQTGSASELPKNDKEGWSVETSLDVEMVHSACRKCRILLVEAESAALVNLAAATRTAAAMGVQEISNSYGSHELGRVGAAESAGYNDPGVVVAAATGDDGWDGWENQPSPESPEFPASMPTVVAVGGTTLELDAEGRRARERVWNSQGNGASGGGCSTVFAAPFWQRYAPGFPATGCGDRRLSADVSAVANPETGFDIYDSYDCGPKCEEFIGAGGWATIGGTSVATPLISSMYALAGGADGIEYPALTLYAHLGDASLFDVTEGGNGYCDLEGRPCGGNALTGEVVDCEGTTSCNAAIGYDGPSGVGSPVSLEAFKPLPEEEAAARRTAEEAAIAEAARLAAEEAAKRAAEEAAAHPATTPAASSGQGGTAGFKAEKAAVPSVTLRTTRLQAGRGGFVTVKIECPVGETICEGAVSVKTLGAVSAGPGGRASVLTLAGGRFKVAGGHVVSVRLHLTRRAAALLARKGKLRVRVLISAHDSAGATHSSRVTLTLYALKRR